MALGRGQDQARIGAASTAEPPWADRSTSSVVVPTVLWDFMVRWGGKFLQQFRMCGGELVPCRRLFQEPIWRFRISAGPGWFVGLRGLLTRFVVRVLVRLRP